MITLIYFFSSIFSFGLGSLVYFKKKYYLNKSFFLLSCVLALWIFIWGLIFSIESYTLLLTRCLLIPAYFIPVTFNLFTNALNDKDGLSRSEKLFHGCMLTVLLCTAYTDLNIEAATLDGGNLLFVAGPFYQLFGMYALVGCALNILDLIREIKTAAYQKRLQLLYCVIGSSAAILHVIFCSFIGPLMGMIHINKFATLSVLWLIGFCFQAITQHELFNVFVSKVIAYFVSSVFFILLVVVAIFIKQEYFFMVTLDTSYVVLVTVIMSVVFLKITQVIQKKGPLEKFNRFNINYFYQDILHLYVDCYDLKGFAKATQLFLQSKLNMRDIAIFVSQDILKNMSTQHSLQLNIDDHDETLVYRGTQKGYLRFVNDDCDADIFDIAKTYNSTCYLTVFDGDVCIATLFLRDRSRLNIMSIDPNIFSFLANQIKIALGRIKPFEKVKEDFNRTKMIQQQQEKEKMLLETEYSIVKKIQEQFLPKTFINIPNFKFDFIYKASRFVGGDYYDIHSIGKEKVGFILCDVAGKGLESSFTTIQLHSLFHSQINVDFSPKQVMETLNKSVYNFRSEKNHCSAFYLELNPQKKVIKFSDAGNGIAYLVKKDAIVNITNYGGMILGACNNSIYTEGELVIEQGDFIFAATDGLIDMKNTNGERYSEKRLMSLLEGMKVDEVAKKKLLEKEIERFTQRKGYLDDDITVLCIECG